MALDTKFLKKLPQHIAIVMDGNGRWAEKRGMPRHIGHEYGALATEDIVRYMSELGIKYVTLYAFSSENWQRPKVEVDAIMTILENYIKNDANELVKNDIKVSIIGELEKMPQSTQKALLNAMEKTKNCKQMVINVALSYGSINEITNALKRIILLDRTEQFNIDNINFDLIKNNLHTKNLPDPDLFIRTGGEYRLSNCLLLQISYSELYFTNILWPDFQRKDLDLAIRSFAERNRRYGLLETA